MVHAHHAAAALSALLADCSLGVAWKEIGESGLLESRGVREVSVAGHPGGRGRRAVTAPIAAEYGFSLTDLTATTGPDRFIRALAAGYDPRPHGEVRLHFNAFSGFAATAAWISRLRQAVPADSSA
jgi:hypothetical protein